MRIALAAWRGPGTPPFFPGASLTAAPAGSRCATRHCRSRTSHSQPSATQRPALFLRIVSADHWIAKRTGGNCRRPFLRWGQLFPCQCAPSALLHHDGNFTTALVRGGLWTENLPAKRDEVSPARPSADSPPPPVPPAKPPPSRPSPNRKKGRRPLRQAARLPVALPFAAQQKSPSARRASCARPPTDVPVAPCWRDHFSKPCRASVRVQERNHILTRFSPDRISSQPSATAQFASPKQAAWRAHRRPRRPPCAAPNDHRSWQGKGNRDRASTGKFRHWRPSDRARAEEFQPPSQNIGSLKSGSKVAAENYFPEMFLKADTR